MGFWLEAGSKSWLEVLAGCLLAVGCRLPWLPVGCHGCLLAATYVLFAFSLPASPVGSA